MSQNKKGFVWAVVLIIVSLSLLLLIVFFGVKSLLKLFFYLLLISVVLLIFGVVVYAVYWLFFKKQRFDATYMNKKSLIRAGLISKPTLVKDLFLSGDKGHSRVKVGKIVGYCRIQIMKKIYDYDSDGKPVYIYDSKNTNLRLHKFHLEKEEQDVFIVEKDPFPLNLFSEPMVIRVSPSDHDELVGDVTLYGFSLIPISEYFYLSKDYLDVRKIDFSILKEAERGIFFESLKDTKEIIDRAVGLDSNHKKKIEEKNLYEIPKIPIDRGGGF